MQKYYYERMDVTTKVPKVYTVSNENTATSAQLPINLFLLLFLSLPLTPFKNVFVCAMAKMLTFSPSEMGAMAGIA